MMMSPLQYSWPYHSHSKHFSQRKTRRHLYYNNVCQKKKSDHFAAGAGFEEFPGEKVDDDVAAAVELTVPLAFFEYFH